jgi:hypothetical protein
MAVPREDDADGLRHLVDAGVERRRVVPGGGGIGPSGRADEQHPGEQHRGDPSSPGAGRGHGGRHGHQILRLRRSPIWMRE